MVDQAKMPRKTKKRLLGKRISRNKLKKMLSSVHITHNKYPEPATISPYPFCPRCGCRHVAYTSNMVSFPEIYVQGRCGRCGFLVEQTDNGPPTHALEHASTSYAINATENCLDRRTTVKT